MSDNPSNNKEVSLKKHRQRQNIKVSIVGSGGFFGEYEIFHRIPRVFKVVCLSSKVSVFSMTKKKFINYFQENTYLQDFFLKKATETHLWHLNRLEKIKKGQDVLKISNSILEVKATKRLYNYKPIRSSVADIQEVIMKESDLFSILDPRTKGSKPNDKQQKTKIEITFYEHNFFRGKRILSNEGTAAAKEKNTSLIEETQPPLQSQTQNLGSKIVEVVSNNQKALKLIKKQKDFSNLLFFSRFFDQDPKKDNKPRKLQRPQSAQFSNKASSSFFKNELKVSFSRPNSCKPEAKEIVNFHMRKKSQNALMNTSKGGTHQRIMSAGFQRKKSAVQLNGEALSDKPNQLKGILNILAYRKSLPC